jgi:hypothetical protein
MRNLTLPNSYLRELGDLELKKTNPPYFSAVIRRELKIQRLQKTAKNITVYPLPNAYKFPSPFQTKEIRFSAHLAQQPNQKKFRLFHS